MALTLDATVGGLNSNTYLTLAEAESYFEAHLYSTEWDNAANDKKEAALAYATRVLDDTIIWSGWRFDEDQALAWPRGDVYDRDGYWIDQDIIPEQVKHATAELALKLIQSDRTADAGTEGFESIKVGPLTLNINPNDRAKIIPDGVRAMLSHLVTSYTEGKPTQVMLSRI